MSENTNVSKIPCPTCKKFVIWQNNPFRPFCSERCRMLDLGKWASEDYRIPEEGKNSSDETKK